MSDKTGKELTNADKSRAVALFDLEDGSWIARFRNDGEVTDVRVSTFAMDALVNLYIRANKADAVFLEDGDLKFARMHA